MEVQQQVLRHIIRGTGNIFRDMTYHTSDKIATVPLDVMADYIFVESKEKKPQKKELFSKEDITRTLQTVKGDMYVPMRIKLPKINRQYDLNLPSALVQLVSGIILSKEVAGIAGVKSAPYKFGNRATFYDMQELMITALPRI